MDSAAKSAAAAPSSGDAETAMAVLPNGKRDDRDDDADGIADNGSHMVCPHCGKGPYCRYSNLAAHVEALHSGLKPPPRLKYACTCHGRLFWHRWVRDQHERDAVRVTCRHCGREMTRASVQVPARGTRRADACMHRVRPRIYDEPRCGGYTPLPPRRMLINPQEESDTSQQSTGTRRSPHLNNLGQDLYPLYGPGGTPKRMPTSSLVDC